MVVSVPDCEHSQSQRTDSNTAHPPKQAIKENTAINANLTLGGKLPERLKAVPIESMHSSGAMAAVGATGAPQAGQDELFCSSSAMQAGQMSAPSTRCSASVKTSLFAFIPDSVSNPHRRQQPPNSRSSALEPVRGMNRVLHHAANASSKYFAGWKCSMRTVVMPSRCMRACLMSKFGVLCGALEWRPVSIAVEKAAVAP